MEDLLSGMKDNTCCLGVVITVYFLVGLLPQQGQGPLFLGRSTISKKGLRSYISEITRKVTN